MMKIERFEQIIGAYGTEPDHWPPEERAAALDLLAENDHCQELIESERPIDMFLGNFLVRPSTLTIQHILQHLPQTRIDRLVAWLLPQEFKDIWRPLTAGALPLVLGTVISLTAMDPLANLLQPTQSWEAEIDLLALRDTDYLSELIDD